ncbi:MAG: ABC transporter substrate-binding protein [Treponema sp.]|jgi:raffinose/stachyose/melibiose transport system substrate-binding protein|nr:ABC transporter substrate-binding protein [Treponema sp.]
MKKLPVVLGMLILFSLFMGCKKDKGYDLYIFNSKGENATQFADMAKAYQDATGVRVKVFSIGSGQDHSEPLNAEMNSRNKPVIFSVQGIKEMVEWQQGGFLLDLSTVTDPAFANLVGDIAPSLRLSTDGKTSYGIPYNVEGYGYIVDKQMLGDIFGPANVDKALAAIKTASYAEWEALVKALDAWIKAPAAAQVTLSGQSFSFAGAKTGLASNLNGVFAVMGSEKWTYGDHFVNVALNAFLSSPNEANSATDDTIRSGRAAFVDYAQALDLKTSYLAGKDGPAKRGQDFVSSSNFGYDQAVQIFADGKAVFFKQGNWAYGNIANVNRAQAERLSFLPVKIPYKSGDVVRGDVNAEQLNRSIPVFVPNYYTINALSSDAEKKYAYDFLVWMNTAAAGQKFVVEDFAFIPYNADPATTKLPNSLGNSIISYINSGDIMAAPYSGAPATWSGDVLGLRLMEQYMTKATWTPQDYSDIADYAVDQWIRLKK